MKLSIYCLLLLIFMCFSCAKEKPPIEPTFRQLERIEANLDTLIQHYDTVR